MGDVVERMHIHGYMDRINLVKMAADEVGDTLTVLLCILYVHRSTRCTKIILWINNE